MEVTTEKGSQGTDSGYHSGSPNVPNRGALDIDRFYGVSRDHNPAAWAGLNNRDMTRTFSMAESEDLDFIEGDNLSVVESLIPSKGSCDHPSEVLTRSKMNKKKRVVLKDGTTSVTYKNISKKWRVFLTDIYTTLLDAPWIHCILMFSASFYGSWLMFGVLYYLISLSHGDFVADKAEGHIPCILEVYDFTSCFLFSLETQHTIGYGTRQTTTECPHAIIIMSLQSVLGCLIQAFMVGLVFSKLSRPRNRSKTVIFGNNAVINLRNRKLCLVIRVGDLRDDNFILGCQISVKTLRRRITEEGEIYHEMKMIKVDPDTASESCMFFVWPLDLVHVIDEDSPFYDISAADLARERFELLVIMEGTIETSSMNFQARTSYLPNEILWGHRFESMILYRRDHNNFHINFSAFHGTYEVDTPTCTARMLDDLYAKVNNRPMDLVATTSNGPLGPALNELRNKSSPLSVSRSNSNSMRRSASLGAAMTAGVVRRQQQRQLTRPESVALPGERVHWVLGDTTTGTPPGQTMEKGREVVGSPKQASPSLTVGTSESGVSLESASKEEDEERRRKGNYTQL